ncbi:MAG TPA: flavin reductase family protein [Terriglobales bacterium]|nr:flavin reductase family protein [Terriglobales bacterium]
MIFDPRSLPPGRFYSFMTSVIVPRPIAFVTTVDPAGRVNAAPFSFFCGIGSAPPLLGLSLNLRSGEPKDTLRNLRAIPEFVVNVVTEGMAEPVVKASGDWPREVEELALVGLTPVPADRVRPPRVAESPVHLECRLEREVPLGETVFVIGEILLGHVHDGVLSEGRVDVTRLKPLARLGGDQYARLGDVLRFARPRLERKD